MRRGKANPLLNNIRITDLAAEGKAIAKVDGKVLFVPFAVPGDLVDVQVTRKRKNYLEGYVTVYHELSKDRVEPFCQHFGVCGGCKWQNLPYQMQLNLKQEQVVEQLTRIGKLQLPEVNSILGFANTRYYRNKLEFT
ncbi:MAG: TRAM domain-containing protein, partial [Bacteroidales bacterium]|nr:TRAM domain-containing protein [Bacteroidales bacterium]